MAGFSFFSSALPRWGATRGPPYPLRGCPRARALEWESWISLRWLFGDSNAVVSLRWGLGGLRHFRGALRPSRHSSRGLPTGSAIRCHSSTSCAGAYDSGFVGPRLLDVATGGVWDSFVLLPRILGCWGSFTRAFLPGRLGFTFKKYSEFDILVRPIF